MDGWVRRDVRDNPATLVQQLVTLIECHRSPKLFRLGVP